MPVAINTFVILGGLMNEDNVVATLKQNAMIKRRFTDVWVEKVSDLDYGLVDHLCLRGKNFTIRVRFPVEGKDHYYSKVTEEMFVATVLEICENCYKQRRELKEDFYITDIENNHNIRLKLSSQNLDFEIDKDLIVGTFLDFNVVLQIVCVTENSIHRTSIPVSYIDGLGLDKQDLIEKAIGYSTANGFSLRRLTDALKEAGKPVDTFDNSEVYVLTLNDSLSYSSVILMCNSILQAVRDRLHENFYVLPCSQYELIIMPESEGNEFGIAYMEASIYTANQNVVTPKEFLSNSLYYFDGSLLVVR